MEIIIPLYPKFVLVALFVLLTEHCLDEEIFFRSLQVGYLHPYIHSLREYSLLDQIDGGLGHALGITAEEPL